MYTFEYVRGDTTPIVFSVSQNGSLVPFSGQTLQLSYQKDADTVVTISGTETSTGIISFTPSATDIDTAGDFDFDMQATNGTVVRTWFKGVIKVVGDVTP